LSNPTDKADVAIIGGGAAGLAAAIFAAQSSGSPRRIVLLDSAKSLGAKILVSGGGRCNVTHDVVTPQDFNGSPNIVRNILAAFNVETTVRWFASLGVELKREETGKLFPTTDSAQTVLNALLNRCAQLNTTIRTNARVTGIQPPAEPNAPFTIDHTDGSIRASRLILCTGGRSLPKTGSDGSGWDLATQLSHSVTPTYAALVPLVLDDNFFHPQLTGISQDVSLSTVVNKKRIDHRTGSLLWTHFGISGPVVMDASRHWVIASETGQNPQMLCNLLSGDTFESAERWLIDLATSRAKTSVLKAIGHRVRERPAAAILARLSIDPATTCSQLSRDSRRALTHTLTALPLPVLRHRGWNYAEVTAGGVPLNEINFRTMESRKTPNLYLAGEILDCDGRIGGYNFQWAWATGFLAANAAASDLTEPSVTR
jgi:predicted Rossmann fold flavoprotein